MRPSPAVQRDAATAEAERIATLERNYQAAVAAGDWKQAAILLNTYNDEDINKKLRALNHDQLISVDAGALQAMPGWSKRVVEPLARLDPEADRVGRLTADYEGAIAAGNWNRAALDLNAFNTDDIIAKLSQLNSAGLVSMQGAARRTNAGGGRLTRMVRYAGGTAVSTTADEQVGANVFTVQGGYRYWITPTAIIVGVGMNFKPDSGVTVPVNQWFQYIRNTWNRFSAVNELNPSQRKQIVFVPMQGKGHDIRVSAGDGRANAARYYASDSRASVSVPHEFGHLIGFQDEYERDIADYSQVAAGATTISGGPAGTPATARAIATAIHDALFLSESFWERHRTAERRRMRAVEKVLADNHIAVDYQRGESIITHEIAAQYWDLYKAELSRHVMTQIDSSEQEFSDWRERVVGSFQYTSTSIMGDMSDHTHPVAARHVRAFATYIEEALGYGRWVPRENP
jgi:hypothetical protein